MKMVTNNSEVKQAKVSSNELILCLLAGLRKTNVESPEAFGYNEALADVYDYILDAQAENLLPNTVRQGKWIRDKKRIF